MIRLARPLVPGDFILMRRLKRFAAPALLTLILAAACGFAHTAFSQDAPAAAKPQQTPPADSASWTVLEDQWMIMEIAGSRVGWMNTIIEQSGEQFRTTTVTEMKVGRGDASVSIRMDSAFIETADGRPVRVNFIQKMAKQAVETSWEFAGDKVKQISKQGGRETTTEMNVPKGDWMTPYKADRYAKEQRKAGAKEIAISMIDPQNGLKPVSTKSIAAGETEYEFGGKKSQVQVWKTTTDIMPIEATEYYDAGGDMVYQELPTGMGKIVTRTATKAQAMQEAAGGGPEVLAKTFIKPDKPIEHSMKASTAKLKLVARQGKLPDLPSAGSQRVQMSDDHKSAILTIDINDELTASEADKTNEEFTKPSTMIDFDDALVTKLSKAARNQTDAMTKAEALRKVVNTRISKKEMGTVFASASETARTQTGDCSEHGVLLAALLRAQHIPARVAMGLVYAEAFMGEKGIFGWHMWTQGLIDGKWVDLDATLPVRYSAAHVLTNTASLADGLGASDMGSIMQLLGNIDIQVLDVGYADE